MVVAVQGRDTSVRDTISKGGFVQGAQHPRIFGRGHIGRGHINPASFVSPLPSPPPPARVQKKINHNLAKNICITMYIVRTYECTSQILKKLSQMVQNYSELYLAVHCKLPSERDGPGF